MVARRAGRFTKAWVFFVRLCVFCGDGWSNPPVPPVPPRQGSGRERPPAMLGLKTTDNSQFFAHHQTVK